METSYSMSYSMGGEFTCYIDECGCPGAFLKTWCSSTTGLITSEWCNESPDNCEHCTGSVCYAGQEPEDPAPIDTEVKECYINQCGCPGSFAETWCSENTAKITSSWCAESESNCGMCSGSYCEAADPLDVPVAPVGECYISQCGCPGSYGETWCTDSIAKITSEWCNENEDHCGNCAGSYCETAEPYVCPAGAVMFAAYPGYAGDKVVTGCVVVAEVQAGITITGVVSGLAADGTGGLHIHSGNSCATADGPGGHYFEGMDVDPWTTNYVSDASGSATIDFALDDFSMHNAYPVAMRTVVVHDVDGVRIACGNIGD